MSTGCGKRLLSSASTVVNCGDTWDELGLDVRLCVECGGDYARFPEPCLVKAANGAEPNSLPQSQEPKSDSEPGLDGRLLLALGRLTIALAELTEGLTKQAEAISQLAMSNEALANSVASQPDEDEEQESGYLS